MKAVHFRTGKHEGLWNMAFDKYVMEQVRDGGNRLAYQSENFRNVTVKSTVIYSFKMATTWSEDQLVDGLYGTKPN